MQVFRHLAVLAAGIIALASCARPQPPPSDILAAGMAEALRDTGFYSEVGITRTIGQHYNPGDDSWKVFACFRFTLSDGGEGTNCVDSFSAMRLQDGSWIVAVTINDVYRWRAIDVSPATGRGAATDTGQ